MTVMWLLFQSFGTAAQGVKAESVKEEAADERKLLF